MNYTSIHIISFFQETIKAHQIALTSLLFALFWTTSCLEANSVRTIPDVEVEKTELMLHPNEGKWYYKNQPFSGFVVVYFENGIIAQRVGYFNGKKEGLAQKCYVDGSLQKTSNYVENRLTGTVKAWWPNGKLSVMSNFVNGSKHGIQKKWYQNGQLSKQTTSNFGKEDGLQQAWLENGKLYANYEVKNGRIFGLKRSNLCYQLNDENIQYKNL